MSLDDYLDHLLKLGMGWLGWTEAETLDTSMVAIVMAYDARISMLQSIFGKGEAKPGEPSAETVSSDESVPIADRLKSAFRALTGRSRRVEPTSAADKSSRPL